MADQIFLTAEFRQMVRSNLEERIRKNRHDAGARTTIPVAPAHSNDGEVGRPANGSRGVFQRGLPGLALTSRRRSMFGTGSVRRNTVSPSHSAACLARSAMISGGICR